MSSDTNTNADPDPRKQEQRIAELEQTVQRQQELLDALVEMIGGDPEWYADNLGGEAGAPLTVRLTGLERDGTSSDDEGDSESRSEQVDGLARDEVQNLTRYAVMVENGDGDTLKENQRRAAIVWREAIRNDHFSRVGQKVVLTSSDIRDKVLRHEVDDVDVTSSQINKTVERICEWIDRETEFLEHVVSKGTRKIVAERAVFEEWYETVHGEV